MNKPKELLNKAIDLELRGQYLDPAEIKIIATNAQCSKLYAQKVLHGRFYEGEEVIRSNLAQTYLYAKDVIEGKWAEGEEILAKDAYYSCEYAKNVLFGRFIKGEKAIAKSGEHSAFYAITVINGRFEKGENAILEESPAVVLDEYSRECIKGRWPEAEPKLLKDISSACSYACYHKFRWEEIESEILKNPDLAIDYAENVIEGSWEEAEDIISTDAGCAMRYSRLIDERFEKGEDSIIKNNDSWQIRSYIQDILKGHRWEKLECFIENSNLTDEEQAELIRDYADAVGFQMPDFIHNRMLALGLVDECEDWRIKRYFQSLEEREENEKSLLIKGFSLERLKEILGREKCKA
jgi:hypothetical protein